MLQRNLLPTIALIALAISIIIPQQAAAQGTFGALPDPISSRDLNNYADRLDLSDQQMLAITEPHMRYLEQFRVLRESEMQAFLDQFRGMRRSFDPAQMTQLVNAATDFNRLLSRIRVLDEQFFSEMQLLLTQEQTDMIPRLRQQRERVRYTGEATRFLDFINPAVRIDLSDIVLELDLPPDQLEVIDPILAQYEMRLTAQTRRIFDASLKMFTDGLKQFQELGFTEDAMSDRGQMMRMFGAVQEIWADVSVDMLRQASDLTGLHRSTYRQLAAMLPEDASRLVRDRYLSRAYPQAASIGRTAEAHFAAALELEAVPDDLRRSITAMAQGHMFAQDRLANEMIDLLDQRRRSLSLMQMANMGQDAAQQQITELSERAQTADQTAIDTLNAMLGPDLASQVRPTPIVTVRSNRIAAMRMQAGGRERGRRDDGAGRRGGPPAGSPWAMARSATDFLTETRPPDRISAADLQEYASLLQMNTSQQVILESLHEDYLEQFESIRREFAVPYTHIVEQLRNRNTELSQEERAELLLQGLDLLEQLVEAVQSADEQFFADVRVAVINARNEDHVNALQGLAIARNRSLYQTPAERTGRGPAGFGGPANEGRVDLASLLPQLALEQESTSEIAPIVAAYISDSLSKFRDRFHAELEIHRSTAELTSLPRGGDDRDNIRQRAREAGQRMGEVRTAANEVYEALRSMNRDALATLQDTLPESAAAQLRGAYYRAAYPNVFDDPDSADTALQTAFALPDLSESQRSQLFEIAADYRPDYNELLERILDHHIALAELSMAGGPMVRGPGGARGGGNWEQRAEHMNALGVLNFDRTELNERTMRQLRSVLSPSQFDHISEQSDHRRAQVSR